MIVTKAINFTAWSAAVTEAARNGGVVWAVATLSVAAVFVLIAECPPARRWIIGKLLRMRT